MGWHIRFAAFKGTGISDRGDSIHRPFWSAFLYNLLNSYSMFLFSIHKTFYLKVLVRDCFLVFGQEAHVFLASGAI